MSQINATIAALAAKPLHVPHTVRKEPTDRVSRINMLWAAFDSATGVITSKHLPEIAERTGMNVITVRNQFYAWRATRAKQAA